MTESSSSSINTNTIFIYNDDDNNDIPVNKPPNVNDVLAIKNNECYFKIGKVHEINHNLINITLFHYKLDIKFEQVIQQEMLFNFGNIGSKSIFELNDKRQKLLIHKLVELDANYSTLLQMMVNDKNKQEVIDKMEIKLEAILEKLIIAENPAQLLKQLIEDQTIEVNKVISFVFDHMSHIQNEAMIQYLAPVIAGACLKKSLIDVGNQFNSLDDNDTTSSKRIFLKKILSEVGRLVKMVEPDDVDLLFVANYVRLSSIALSW